MGREPRYDIQPDDSAYLCQAQQGYDAEQYAPWSSLLQADSVDTNTLDCNTPVSHSSSQDATGITDGNTKYQRGYMRLPFCRQASHGLI